LCGEEFCTRNLDILYKTFVFEYGFCTLVVEVFGCLHKQTNGFLQACAHNIWMMKGLQGWYKFLVVYTSKLMVFCRLVPRTYE
jgi:hypothetical protein